MNPIKHLAQHLGIDEGALVRLSVIYDGNAYLIPERNADGEVIGHAKRYPNGKKGAVAGGRRGLTMAWPLEAYAGSSVDDPILVVEGMSDCAAGLSLGFTTVGRPSASGGSDLLMELLKDRHVVVVGENDANGTGQREASKLAEKLAAVCASAKVVHPSSGVKDLREWFNAPAPVTRDELLAAIRVSDRVELEGKAQPKKRLSQADELVAIADEAELFHALDGANDKSYATIPVEKHRETWPIGSRHFRYWLGRRFRTLCEKVPSTQAVQEALTVIAGEAIYGSPARPVAVRIAEYHGNIYLDMADNEWRVIEVTPHGWRVIESVTCPVRFIRRGGMLALPTPVTGGTLDELRPLLNVPDENDWVLVLALMVAYLRPTGPYPVLCANGEQGSAKTTLLKFIRALIDPNEPDLRRPPKDERDLMIAARNNWIVAFDNLSGIAPNLSDALCTLATGGGFATRALYSDDEEKLFSAQRPIMVNGIDDLATRPDLLDRAVCLTLPTIDETKRLDEKMLLTRSEAVRPRVLGALLDAASVALRDVDAVALDRLPRMADFARWATAAESALGLPPGAVMAAYTGNRTDANSVALETSAIGPALLRLMQDRGRWSGTASDLMAELANYYPSDGSPHRRDRPSTPKAMSDALRRIATNLRAAGIIYTPPQRCGHDRRRVLTLEQVGNGASASSARAANHPGEQETGGKADDTQTMTGGVGLHRPRETTLGVAENVDADSADDADGQIPARSGCWPDGSPVPIDPPEDLLDIDVDEHGTTHTESTRPC